MDNRYAGAQQHGVTGVSTPAVGGTAIGGGVGPYYPDYSQQRLQAQACETRDRRTECLKLAMEATIVAPLGDESNHFDIIDIAEDFYNFIYNN